MAIRYLFYVCLYKLLVNVNGVWLFGTFFMYVCTPYKLLMMAGWLREPDEISTLYICSVLLSVTRLSLWFHSIIILYVAFLLELRS